MLVEGKILPNPHKVEVPDDLLGLNSCLGKE